MKEWPMFGNEFPGEGEISIEKSKIFYDELQAEE